MDFSNIIKNNKNFHFIGIGGVSMSALAKYLFSNGKKVTGSDLSDGESVKRLTSMGIKVYSTHSQENVGNAQVVVYTSAVPDDNAELEYAKKRGLILLKRSELLGGIAENFSRTVGVAGSHGKTTATAMLARILETARLDPTCFIGGNDKKLGNFKKGNSEYCVYEACEYKRNFLDLKPYVSVVLNVDMDHADCYLDETQIVSAFKEYSSRGLSVINADDELSRQLITQTSVTFGIRSSADYVATGLKTQDGCYSFSVRSKRRLGRINLKIRGSHNVYNALAAITVADILGVRFHHIKRALESFDGVGRRMEDIGYIFGAKAYADYAHHPREISETLKEFDDGLVVFQPHTFSRTKFFMDDFISCLSKYDRVIIYRTYPAREKFNEAGSAKTLFNKLKNRCKRLCFYADTPNDLKILVGSTVGVADKVIFLGAGDIYDVAKEIID